MGLDQIENQKLKITYLKQKKKESDKNKQNCDITLKKDGIQTNLSDSRAPKYKVK